jgi:hypothetical protein
MTAMSRDQDLSNERTRPSTHDIADLDRTTRAETAAAETQSRPDDEARDTEGRPAAEMERDDAPAEGGEALLSPEDTVKMQQKWQDIQSRFVDEPREAVESADGLVAELMQALAARFAEQRSALEDQWQRGGDVNTEQLRRVLRDYRAFFDRLLTA